MKRINEKVIVESERAKNYFLIIGIAIFVIGFSYGEINDFDRIELCIYPWAFSFYYVWPSVLLLILGVIHFGNEIVVTDNRVYGKSVFGKRVDLPLDSISAVGTSWPKCITIATASGRVSFSLIKNRDEIHKAVSDLLIARQEKGRSGAAGKQEIQQSSADELKKYKELLDGGVISQEEFEMLKSKCLAKM